MRHAIPLLVVLALSAGLLAQTSSSASPDVLFKQAQQRELVDGDVPGAIALYRQIVDRHPDSSLAPQALLRLGGIYQGQGRAAEARQSYELIVARYGDSGAPADAARLALGASEPPAATSELTVPDACGVLGSVSPDGRFIACDAWDGTYTNLAVWDVATGDAKVITAVANRAAIQAGAVWSPDGRRIAWAYRPGTNDARGPQTIVLVDRDTGRMDDLLVVPDDQPWIRLLDWSPNGRFVAVGLGRAAGEGSMGEAGIMLISVADRSTTTLRRLDGNLPATAAFSPDGEFLAYDARRDPSTPSDVRVIAVDSTDDHPITDDESAHDLLLGWLPDGRLLLASDREGGTNAYAVAVRSGKAEGRLTMVRRDLDQLRPLGIATDGRLFALSSSTRRDLYVAELDPLTGRAVRPLAPLARVQPAVNRKQGTWSPDGTRIAYVQFATGIPETVVVQSVATGDVSVHQVPVRNLDHPLWTPDGRGFLFDGTGDDDQQRMYRLDLESGTTEAVTDCRCFIHAISPDGRFAYQGTSEPRGQMVRRDLRGDDTDIVVPAEEGRGTLGSSKLSPDGRWFAFFTRTPRRGALAIRPADGGERTVVVPEFGYGYPRLAWTPDSRYVIFAQVPGGVSRVPIDGGAPELLGVEPEGMIWQFSMHPDGRRLALDIERSESRVVVWNDLMQGETRR